MGEPRSPVDDILDAQAQVENWRPLPLVMTRAQLVMLERATGMKATMDEPGWVKTCDDCADVEQLRAALARAEQAERDLAEERQEHAATRAAFAEAREESALFLDQGHVAVRDRDRWRHACLAACKRAEQLRAGIAYAQAEKESRRG